MNKKSTYDLLFLNELLPINTSFEFVYRHIAFANRARVGQTAQTMTAARLAQLTARDLRDERARPAR